MKLYLDKIGKFLEACHCDGHGREVFPSTHPDALNETWELLTEAREAFERLSYMGGWITDRAPPADVDLLVLMQDWSGSTFNAAPAKYVQKANKDWVISIQTDDGWSHFPIDKLVGWMPVPPPLAPHDFERDRLAMKASFDHMVSTKGAWVVS